MTFYKLSFQSHQRPIDVSGRRCEIGESRPTTLSLYTQWALRFSSDELKTKYSLHELKLVSRRNAFFMTMTVGKEINVVRLRKFVFYSIRIWMCKNNNIRRLNVCTLFDRSHLTSSNFVKNFMILIWLKFWYINWKFQFFTIQISNAFSSNFQFFVFFSLSQNKKWLLFRWAVKRRQKFHFLNVNLIACVRWSHWTIKAH